MPASSAPTLDGLLVNPGITWFNNPMASYSLQQAMGLRNLRLTATMNLGGANRCRDGHACRPVYCRRDGRLRRMRIRRRSTASALAEQGQGRGLCERLRIRARPERALRPFRRQCPVCLRRAAPYASLRHHRRSARRYRRRRARVGQLQPRRPVFRYPDDTRRLPCLPMGG